MKVNKNWWKDFFNEVYLITDARTVGNSTLTKREVDLIEEFLKLDKNDNILDLCGGQGRHSLELAKRGYKNLTVLDFSNYLIKLGKRKAKEAGLNIKFLCRDARSTKLKDNSFSVVFIMGNCFGYFQDEKENFKILKEAKRLLKNKCRLLLDLTDSNYVKRNLKPLSWHKASLDIIVLRKRKLENNLIKVREIVISKKKGLIRDGKYCQNLYSKDRISSLLKKAGFKKIAIKDGSSFDKEKKDLGLMTCRVIVKAEK